MMMKKMGKGMKEVMGKKVRLEKHRRMKMELQMKKRKRKMGKIKMGQVESKEEKRMRNKLIRQMRMLKNLQVRMTRITKKGMKREKIKTNQESQVCQERTPKMQTKKMIKDNKEALTKEIKTEKRLTMPQKLTSL